MAIHPTAAIESGAKIGANVMVGAFAFIDAQTKIGDGCVIGPNSTILRFTTLGANCRVHAAPWWATFRKTYPSRNARASCGSAPTPSFARRLR